MGGGVNVYPSGGGSGQLEVHQIKSAFQENG